MAAGAAPRKVDVRIAEDGRQVLERIVPVSGGITEMRLSPNGKEIAYVFRGEIFVGSVEGGVTKRITNTPWQERSVSFSPDGRTLVYAAEKDNNWNVYTTSIVRKEEPYFYASTVLKEEPVVATPAEEFQPEFSPDGKEVAYLENRVVLKVVNLASKQTRTILPADHNYSYADGDQNYQWSPDGKWFLVQFGFARLFTPQIGLVSSDGKGEVVNLTKSGFDNVRAPLGHGRQDDDLRHSARGRRQHRRLARRATTSTACSSPGPPSTSSACPRRTSPSGRSRRTRPRRRRTRPRRTSPRTPRPRTTAAKTEEPKKDLVIELDGLDRRKVRLTIHSADIADMALSKNGEKLFYLARFEKGYDLWVTETADAGHEALRQAGRRRRRAWSCRPTASSSSSAPTAGSLKIDPESGKIEPVAIGGEMVLDQTAEKAYMFDHMWRQMKQKFLVADLYGADWDYYYGVYKKFLPFINNNYDYAEMVSEMLGEMNVSHTGCYYSGARPPTADATAALGLFMDYDFAGPGLKVAEILSGGPLDKAALKIRAGHVIEKIDGQVLDGADRPLQAPQPQGRQADPAVRLRSGHRQPLGGGGQAHLPGRGERPPLPALGQGPPGRSGPPVRRPDRLRPRRAA